MQLSSHPRMDHIYDLPLACRTGKSCYSREAISSVMTFKDRDRRWKRSLPPAMQRLRRKESARSPFASKNAPPIVSPSGKSLHAIFVTPHRSGFKPARPCSANRHRAGAYLGSRERDAQHWHRHDGQACPGSEEICLRTSKTLGKQNSRHAATSADATVFL